MKAMNMQKAHPSKSECLIFRNGQRQKCFWYFHYKGYVKSQVWKGNRLTIKQNGAVQNSVWIGKGRYLKYFIGTPHGVCVSQEILETSYSATFHLLPRNALPGTLSGPKKDNNAFPLLFCQKSNEPLSSASANIYMAGPTNPWLFVHLGWLSPEGTNCQV